VMLEPNVSIAKFNKALKEFKKAATGAEWAVFYYAGHGLQAGGVNYLVPVDAEDLDEEVDLKQKTVALDDVLNLMGEVQKLRIVILDACRSPLSVGATRGGARGLAPADQIVKNDATTYIIYATQAGRTADDGLPNSKNSPFTTALARHLPKPGLEVTKLVGLIGDDLEVLTGGKQSPAFYVGGRMTSADYAFRPVQVAAKPAGGDTPQVTTRAAQQTTEVPLQVATGAGGNTSDQITPKLPGAGAGTGPGAGARQN
jgi:caspase domain-containing protein